MAFSKLATATSGNGGQYSARGSKVDRIILHHCASTSLSTVLGMMSTGSREVSANYVIGNGGEIVGVVPEEYRAWTSGSSSWDGRAITFEIVNETGDPDWRISSRAFDAVARMLADLSKRYGITLSRDTVITHQELYSRYGASYATACPGPYLQARIDSLIALAKTYLAGAAGPTPASVPEEEDEDMPIRFIAHRPKGSTKDTEFMIVHPDFGADLKAGQKRVDGNATTFRGYIVSREKTVGDAWGRTHARQFGNAPLRVGTDEYRAIQTEATRVSVELAPVLSEIHGTRG